MTPLKLVEGKGFVPVEEVIQQTKTNQEAALTKIETLPRLNQQVQALAQSENFQDLAEALQVFTTNTPPQTTQKTLTLKNKKIPPLDMFAALMVTFIYIGITYGALTSFAFGWSIIAGLAGLWLTYVIAVRLTIGGIFN